MQVPGFLGVLIIVTLSRARRTSWNSSVYSRTSARNRIGRIFSLLGWRDGDIGVAWVCSLACYGGRCEILGSICGVRSRRDEGRATEAAATAELAMLLLLLSSTIPLCGTENVFCPRLLFDWLFVCDWLLV